MNITTNNANVNITAGTTKNINFAGSGSVNVSAAQSFNLIPAGTILTTVTSTVPTGHGCILPILMYLFVLIDPIELVSIIDEFINHLISTCKNFVF
jgi:hypothetical protein